MPEYAERVNTLRRIITQNTRPAGARSARTRRLALSGLLLGALMLSTGAGAALAADPLSVAPDGTAEVWVDIEGSGAGEALSEVGFQHSTSEWIATSPAHSPFGVSAVLQAQPGAIDLRFKISAPLTADIAVSYVDGDGVVLGERLLGSVALTQKLADSDGWVSWADLAESSGGTDDGSGGADGGADGTHDHLVRSGAEAPGSLVIIAVLLVAAAGSSLLLRARRASRAAGDAQSTDSSEAGK